MLYNSAEEATKHMKATGVRHPATTDTAPTPPSPNLDREKRTRQPRGNNLQNQRSPPQKKLHIYWQKSMNNLNIFIRNYLQKMHLDQKSILRHFILSLQLSRLTEEQKESLIKDIISQELLK